MKRKILSNVPQILAAISVLSLIIAGTMESSVYYTIFFVTGTAIMILAALIFCVLDYFGYAK